MKRRSSGSLSLSQTVVGFVNYKFAEGLTDRSVYSYQRLLNKWIEYAGDKCVAEVSVQDIRQYLAWLRTEYQPRRYDGKTHPISPKTLGHIGLLLQVGQSGIRHPQSNAGYPSPALSEVTNNALHQSGSRSLAQGLCAYSEGEYPFSAYVSVSAAHCPTR